MKVIGIDPGSRKTGYAVVYAEAGNYTVVASGIITDSSKDIYYRINNIFLEVSRIIKTYSPDTAAIENVFFSKNVDSLVKLSYARAAAILPFMQAGLEVNEYTPLDIKKAISGYGRADKNQVQKMVSLLTGKKKFASSDESDAIAVAITHINQSAFIIPKTID